VYTPELFEEAVVFTGPVRLTEIPPTPASVQPSRMPPEMSEEYMMKFLPVTGALFTTMPL
jgi:hypothetical protein